MFESNQEKNIAENENNSDQPPENSVKPNQESLSGAQEMEKEGEIHTMPDKFFSSDQKTSNTKKSNGRKKLLVIIIIVVVVVSALLGVSIFLFQRIMNQSSKNSDVNSQLNKNINQPVNLNGQINLNENTNEKINLNESVDSNLNKNANNNTNVNKNVNSNKNTNTPFNSNLNINNPPVDSKDTDNDQLTDLEEQIYNTNSNQPDSDQDGYLDGQEVLKGYNPKGSGRISQSEAVDTYTNQTYAYSILYPSSWLEDTISNGKEVWFTSTTGEFMEVLVEKNNAKLSAKEWYLDQINSEEIDPDSLEEVQVGELKGVKSLDGLSVYLAEDDLIYGVIYNIGTKNEINFRTTFTMVYGSLQTGVSVSPNANSNQNINSQANSNININVNNNVNENLNKNSSVNL